jgi:hypothetical protein
MENLMSDLASIDRKKSSTRRGKIINLILWVLIGLGILTRLDLNSMSLVSLTLV